MSTMKELYDQWLDELRLEDLNLSLSTSYVLEQVDPTAYHCGFGDFTDGATFACEDCGLDFQNTDHLTLEDAVICPGCAGLEVCPECGEEVSSGDWAEHRMCGRCAEKAEAEEAAAE